MVTGASRGIGRACSIALAAAGYRVFAGMRTPDGTRVNGLTPVRLDVTKPDEIDACISGIVDKTGGIDAVINNAGLLVSGAVEDIPDQQVREVMDVNFFGALEVTRAALPFMRASGDGHIIFVSSLSGLVALPGDGIYAASKFALEALAESLSFEVQPFGVRVTLLEPGAVKTDLHLNTPKVAPRRSPYARLSSALAKGKSSGARMEPEEVANLIVQAIDDHYADLRLPAGATAERVHRAVGIDNYARRKLVEEASGLRWWLKADAAHNDGTD